MRSDPMTIRFVRTTKYANKCATCNRLIPAGSEAYWDGVLKGKNYHVDCYTSSGDQPKEGGAGGTVAKPVFHYPAPLDVEKEVATNFSEGIKTVLDLFQTDMEHLQKSPALIEAVVEASHQYFSYKMADRIQADKEKNIRAIG